MDWEFRWERSEKAASRRPEKTNDPPATNRRRVAVLQYCRTTLESRLRSAAHGRLWVSRQAVVPGERHPSEELVTRQVPGKGVQQPVVAQVDPAVAAFQQERVALVVEQLGEQRLLSHRAGISRQVS